MIKIDIIKKIYTGNRQTAINQMKKSYQTKGRLIISFLYFGNMMKRRLCETTENKTALQYKKALLESDYILPDGIALQVFCFFISRHWVKNLNGTEFILPLLKSFNNTAHISVIEAYDINIGKGKNLINNAIRNLKEQHNIDVGYYQQVPFKNKGNDINRKNIEKGRSHQGKKTKILIMCIGTPTQEIIVQQKQDFLKENRVLVINAGGRIDFMSGYEKRAPNWIVKIRIGETIWRVVQNPKKNMNKLLQMFGIIRLIIPSRVKNLVLKNP